MRHDVYIVNTVAKIAAEQETKGIEKWKESLYELTTPELLKRLEKYPGVGSKVANCVALDAFHRLECCPVDTWVISVYHEYFGHDERTSYSEVSKFFADNFGEYAGVLQQYLFYAIRKERGALRIN